MLKALREGLGAGRVVGDPHELIVYECDGFTVPREAAGGGLSESTAEVVAAVNVCRERGVAVLPRRARVGVLRGDCCGHAERADQYGTDEKNYRSGFAQPLGAGGGGRAEPGVVGGGGRIGISLCPDPSSQRASTIGGNFATNAGGLHTLKDGVTVNHILGVEIVFGDGTVHTVGGPRWRRAWK